MRPAWRSWLCSALKEGKGRDLPLVPWDIHAAVVSQQRRKGSSAPALLLRNRTLAELLLLKLFPYTQALKFFPILTTSLFAGGQSPSATRFCGPSEVRSSEEEREIQFISEVNKQLFLQRFLYSLNILTLECYLSLKAKVFWSPLRYWSCYNCIIALLNIFPFFFLSFQSKLNPLCPIFFLTSCTHCSLP